MMNRRHWLLGATFAVALAAAPALAFTPEGVKQALDAQLSRLVESNATPGVVALILHEGRPIYRGAAGRRDPASAEPIADAQLFRLASMTKVVTAAAAMILVEDGKLGLDDPVSKYLPEFANLQVLQADGTSVPARRPPTVRELLTHQAGFSYNFLKTPGIAEAYAQAGVTDGLAYVDIGAQQARAALSRAPLAYQPGEGWQYSLATDVLGWVIEAASGQTLDAFIAARIAQPLKLANFGFRFPDARRNEVVVPTTPQDGGGLRVPAAGNERLKYPGEDRYAIGDRDRIFSATAYPSGGGGSSGTIGDYARIIQMLANGGELDGVRILKPETVALMTRNQTGDRPTLRGPGWGHGFGVGVVTDPAAAKTGLPAGSWGWGGIWGTQFWVDPQNKIVGVVMTQTALIGSGPITASVREAFYSAK